jgi:hypothetical protein
LIPWGGADPDEAVPPQGSRAGLVKAIQRVDSAWMRREWLPQLLPRAPNLAAVR